MASPFPYKLSLGHKNKNNHRFYMFLKLCMKIFFNVFVVSTHTDSVFMYLQTVMV